MRHTILITIIGRKQIPCLGRLPLPAARLHSSGRLYIPSSPLLLFRLPGTLRPLILICATRGWEGLTECRPQSSVLNT